VGHDNSVNNTASVLASLSLNNTFTGINTFNNNVFIGNSGLLTCGAINSGEITGTAPTQTINDNSTKLATTAYADASSSAAAIAYSTAIFTGNITYSGNNTYTGNTTMNTLFTSLIDTTNALNDLSIAENPTRTGGINIYTQGDSFTSSTIKIGKASVTTTELNGTTNLNGAVNATSTNNKTIGNTGGGITQINGTTDINNTNIGNTTIGSSGGGTTTLQGTTILNGTNTIGVLNGTNDLAGNVNINTANPNNNTTIGNSSGGGQLFVNCGATFSGTTTNLNSVGNFTRNLVSVKRWGMYGAGSNSDYGNPGNRIGASSVLYRTSGTASFSNVIASGGAIGSAWDNTNGFFTFPETGTYIINVVLFSNGGKISSGVGATAGGGGTFVDGTAFKYLFTDTLPNSAGTIMYNATFLYCASGTNNTFYIGSDGTGSCVIYMGGVHSGFTITKVG
jgi:hypothetical protein